VVRPRSCRVIYYFDTPALGRRHRSFGRVSDLLHDPSSFRRLVGRLIYLTISHPDIVFPVNLLSQFMHHPDNHIIMQLSVFSVTSKLLQAKACISLLLTLFKCQLIQIRTRLVARSLVVQPPVFLFSLAPVLFPGALKSNIRSLVHLLKLNTALLLPPLVNLYGSKHFYMILVSTTPSLCFYIVTTKQLFTLLRILSFTNVPNT